MPNSRRRLTGTVVSNKMDKTVVVQVEQLFRHPLYGKVVSEAKRFMAHDEGNVCEMGDTVVIVESQPISRHKRWAVQEILDTNLSARTTAVSELAGVNVDESDSSDETLVSDATEELEPVAEAEAEDDASEESEE